VLSAEERPLTFMCEEENRSDAYELVYENGRTSAIRFSEQNHMDQIKTLTSTG
jgi:hypothetical protein